ncbi:MAG: FAD-dependent oxidoreductase [Opitutales bacterium]
MMHPVTIVGGGIAGLSLGIALRKKGVEVRLFEKRRYPFHRVCGEFISGVSSETLSELGVAGVLEGSVPIKDVAWYQQDKLVTEHELPRAALGVSRYSLDNRLAELALEAGVQLSPGESYRGQDMEGLVWANGKRLDRGSSWLGLSAHFNNTGSDRLKMYCGPIGYFGASPIENSRVNVTGLFRKQPSIKSRGCNLLSDYLRTNGCTGAAEELESCGLVEGSFCAIAGFEFGGQSVEGFSIGDRSLLIPPFAGNGMSMAFESAAHAAPLLYDYSTGVKSWQECVRDFRIVQDKAFGRRIKVAVRLHPFILSSFGLKAMGTLADLNLLPMQTLLKLLR